MDIHCNKQWFCAFVKSNINVFIHVPVLQKILNSVHCKCCVNDDFFCIFSTSLSYYTIQKILISVNQVWRSHCFCCGYDVVPFFEQNFQIFLNISFTLTFSFCSYDNAHSDGFDKIHYSF